MIEDVTAASCVEFATNVEEMGASLYSSLAKRFSTDRELGELFEGLARDEVQHGAIFRAFRDRMQSSSQSRSVPAQLAHYLRAMSMSEVFAGMKGLHADLDAIRTREDALERALRFEKATLGFFQAMRDVFEEDEVFTPLIAVERGHVAKVMELMITGAKYRGLSDKF
jgi:rubrerythrin